MHEPFLRHCLALAEKARGFVGINPMVGAVLVRDGVIVAEGFHEAFGTAHAERQLLQKSDLKIRSTDTLVVNLEPCCHSDKKTPPCAQFIVEKGIGNVVVGMLDPNPKVAGEGIQFLRSKGVRVTGPLLFDECARLNRGFVSLMTQGRPWITLHEARTIDGRHANTDGSPLKITSEEQDRWAHQFLRARHDAILVGIGTILADDPRLTVRFAPLPHPLTPSPAGRGGTLYRIILDPHFKIPLGAKVVNGELARGTMVVTEEREGIEAIEELEEKKKILGKRGVRVIGIPPPFSPSPFPRRGKGSSPLPPGEGCRAEPRRSQTTVAEQGGVRERSGFDWNQLWQSLTTPTGDFNGITSILVEGGPRTWEMFRNARMVDEEVTLVGSKN